MCGAFLQCKAEYHLQEDNNAGSDATCTSSSMINTCSSPTPSTSSTKTFHRQSTIDDAFKVQRSYEFGGSKDAAISQALIFMVCKDNYPLSLKANLPFQQPTR
ncbi:unnamed protein product [Callosobruchus maculatus]|uniref:Uncharacterized protein n=1 Tax=Callosobruchus maculatus TaxID=64391 RepID=A0A653DA31_CALMS|nr:unnamed protein product [Callosobruchus maculatus]